MILAIATIFILASSVMVSSQSYQENHRFLGTTVDVSSGGTATDGTHFNSQDIRISWAGYGNVVAITISFTGDGSMDGSDVDFFFQVSYDGGTTWTTDAYVEVDVASDAAHSSNVVRHTELVNVHGISHIRLYQIVNNDSTSGITACNAWVSLTTGG